MQTADVVIVGGGIVGSAAAYHLSRDPDKKRRIVIIERDASYLLCSTARSAGGIRQQFSTPENIALSRATLLLLRNLKATFGEDADVSFREQGYLILASAEGQEVLSRNAAIQRGAGADSVLLDTPALAGRFPWLNLDGVAAGCFGQSGEGWIDPVGLMSLLRRAAQSAGVEVLNDEVIALRTTSTNVTSVGLKSGAAIACGALINAAGANAGALARLANIDLPIEPRKRYVYVIDSKRATEAMRNGPLTVDPNGVWLRPEGRTFICGISPAEADEPPAVDLDHIDYPLYEDVVWPAIAARIPAFEEAKLISAWAGYYDYNTLDQNAVIGAHPDFDQPLLRQRFLRPRPAAGLRRRTCRLRTDHNWQISDDRPYALRL